MELLNFNSVCADRIQKHVARFRCAAKGHSRVEKMLNFIRLLLDDLLNVERSSFPHPYHSNSVSGLKVYKNILAIFPRIALLFSARGKRGEKEARVMCIRWYVLYT